eukprot:4805774-Alexandrium_andersonii.AAC.1
MGFAPSFALDEDQALATVLLGNSISPFHAAVGLITVLSTMHDYEDTELLQQNFDAWASVFAMTSPHEPLRGPEDVWVFLLPPGAAAPVRRHTPGSTLVRMLARETLSMSGFLEFGFDLSCGGRSVSNTAVA